MNDKFVIILTILMVFIIIRMNKLEKKMDKIDKNEKFSINLDDKDQQAVTNLLSLVKGEPVTLSSLVLTGNLTVNGNSSVSGNSTVNGLLTVNNGSSFSGGQHIFKDAESKNGEYIRIGNPWSVPGLHVPSGTLNIGNNSRNILIGGDTVNIQGNLNAPQIQNGKITVSDRVFFGNGHYIRNSPSRMIYHNAVTNTPYSGDNVGVEMDEYTIDVTYDHNTWAGLRFWSRHNPGNLDNKFHGYMTPGGAWNK